MSAMAHSHYDYSQPESMFAVTDSSYQFQGSLPETESHDYHVAEETSYQGAYKSYNERPGYPPTQNMTSTDEGDLGTRSRLTQEQLALLEAEFAERYKPNTEYKKTLADKMGVEFQKVNVGDSPACILPSIDIDCRTGFRIAELKQSIRIHKSGDTMFLQSRTLTKVQQLPSTHRWISGACINHTPPKIFLPQVRAQCRQPDLLSPLT